MRTTDAALRAAQPQANGLDVVFPPQNLDLLLDLSHFLEHHDAHACLVGPDGEQVPIPEEIYRVLKQVIPEMRQGKAISLMPIGMRLTTQEAADFLGVSRPTLVKLLESGAIPFDKPNRHRRVRLADLVRYQEQRRTARRAALDAATTEAGELGIYDGAAVDYESALRRARRRRAAQ